MRDTVRSDDDVALDAAREKLAALAVRPGYPEAMAPKPSGSRTARWITGAIAAGLLGLAFWSFQATSSVALRWVLLLLFLAAAVFTALIAIGVGPEPAPAAAPGVVLAKLPDDKLELLKGDGTRETLIALASVHAALKVGDVGVMHVKSGSILVAFHRL